MSDPKPRVPYRTTSGTGPAATGTNAAPPELALCISWKTTPVSGFPAGRTRNRVYIGPLSQSALDTNGRPTSTMLTNFSNSADILLEASKTAAWSWVVFSQAALDAGTSTGVFPIASGWIDNEFDVQRRRGRSATSRTVFS